MTFHVPNQFRIRKGIMRSDDSEGNNGAFFVKYQHPSKKTKNVLLTVIASQDAGWEHVSISLPNRMPIYAHMRFIKNLFWDDEDVVMELHVPKSQHVNNHPYCLHLWRPIDQKIPLPPKEFV